MRVENKHVFFWGGKFSNFFGCHIDYALCNEMTPISFNCSEQIYMAHKALYFGDFEALDKILKSSIPREQKAIGRTVKGFDEDQWLKVAYDFMVRACEAKFSQNLELKSAMLDLGDHTFVEASPLDRIWGVGLAEEDNKILDPRNWKGTNLLGKALNEVCNRLAIQELERMDEEINNSYAAGEEI